MARKKTLEQKEQPRKDVDALPNRPATANGTRVNGDSNGKRKMRQSNELRKSYKEESEDSSDDEPIVSLNPLRHDRN